MDRHEGDAVRGVEGVNFGVTALMELSERVMATGDAKIERTVVSVADAAQDEVGEEVVALR